MMDQASFKQAQELAQQIVSAHGKRNTMLKACEDMFKLRWDDEERVGNLVDAVRVTKSPDPRNALLGAIRLLTATAPVFSVDMDTNSESTKGAADKIEKWSAMVWRAGGRKRGDPLELDVVRSAMIYSEVIISVNSTADMVEATKPGSAARRRAEAVQRETPVLFDVLNPRTCYPVWDGMGLRMMYRESKILVGEVIDRFGDEGRTAVEAVRRNIGRFEYVTLCDLWDLETRTLWVKEASGVQGVIKQGEHGLEALPFEAHIVEGSRMFEMPEDQREPFLYTMLQTKMWNRQNLALTAIFTAVEAMGLNPQFVHKYAGNQPAQIKRDFSTPGGVWEIPAGDALEPLAKGLLDPAVMTALQMAEQKGSESTMYRQALGEPPTSGSTAFSTVNLLAQSGRLPLVTAQVKCSWAVAGAVKLGLKIVRALGKKAMRAQFGGAAVELEPSEIPEVFELECKLDIALPQDRLQLANIASMVKREGLASTEWARKEILQIENNAAMDEQIMAERAAEAVFAALMQQRMQMMQAQQQQPGPGMMGPGMAASGTAGMPMGGPGAVSGGLPAAMANPGANAPGMVMQTNPEGMPPDMAGGEMGIPG